MKRRVALILAVILGITGTLAAYYRDNGADDAPKYITAPVGRGDVVETVQATGTLGAVTTVQVGSQVSGTIKTVIDVPNPGGKLKPGMTASVTVEVARAANVITVPNAALRFQPAASANQRSAERGRHVWTLNGGELQRVPLQKGISDGTRTAVLEGDLAENTLVVTGTASASTSRPASPASSPLLPQAPGGNRQGARGQAGG